jgi:hypothetical protein
MNISSFPEENENSRKSAMKLIIQLLVVSALLFALFRASWWSFVQTLDFLRPAFQTATEAIVFSIIVQYGPQPALFFMGVFKHRFSIAQRERSIWIARNPKSDLVPIDMANKVLWNACFLAFSTMFFLGLSAVDFITNIGEINTTRTIANASGVTIGPMLYWVMIAFAFFVLWVEEIAGNVFVYFFMTLEQLAATFNLKSPSFAKAQGLFRKASGPLDVTHTISGQRPAPRPSAQPYVTNRPSYQTGGRSTPPNAHRPMPNYHPISMDFGEGEDE